MLVRQRNLGLGAKENCNTKLDVIERVHPELGAGGFFRRCVSPPSYASEFFINSSMTGTV